MKNLGRALMLVGCVWYSQTSMVDFETAVRFASEGAAAVDLLRHSRKWGVPLGEMYASIVRLKYGLGDG